LASLRLLGEGAFSEEEINHEFRELQVTIDIQPEKGRFRELFQGVHLKRTLISVGINVFLQLTGQNFVSVYGTIFLKSLGTINPFTLTTINTAINIVMVLITQFLTDITGRV
jgi:MFS transporter, SP family, sugar:H+ symporter